MDLRGVVVLTFVTACGRVAFDDVTSGDGGRDGMQVLGDGSAPLFVSGFDTGLTPWVATGNVNVDTGPPTPIDGTSMLIAQATPASSSRAEVMLPVTVASGALYVRGYFYLPSGYAVNDLSILEVEQAGGGLVLVNASELGLFSGLETVNGAGTFLLGRDVWSCIEVRIGVADVGGTWDVWVDGTLRHSLTGLHTLAGGIDHLYVGITWAGATQPDCTVYVDAIVVDTKPIGCP